MNIFIILFWIASSGHIIDIEEVKIVPVAEQCREASPDVLKPTVPDWDDEVKKGLVPHIVCGISAEYQAPPPPVTYDEGAPPIEIVDGK